MRAGMDRVSVTHPYPNKIETPEGTVWDSSGRPRGETQACYQTPVLQ